MSSIINILIALCILIYFLIYLRGIFKGTAKPVLATWLFFSIATSISLLSNFNITGIKGLSSNFFNLIDTFSVITIFLIIVFRKDTRKKFTTFEKYCIIAVTVVLLFWIVEGKDFLTHIVVQVILVIAYLPSLVKLWSSKENTEPLGTWLFDFFGSAIGLITPIKTGDILPIIYGTRSALSTLLMVIFVLRNKYIKRK